MQHSTNNQAAFT